MGEEELFLDLFRPMAQLAPGSDRSTRRALQSISALPQAANVLDLGCGTGRSTLLLAEETGGRVTAVDNFAPYLEQLQRAAATRGLGHLIDAVVGDMASPPEGPYDLIWAEGAIYILGVDAGLAAWKPHLKPYGWLVFSEISWLTETPPSDARTFWADAYPAMGNVAGNLDRIRNAGLRAGPVVIQPPSDWTDSYYLPLAARLSEWRATRADDPAALAIADAVQAEIDLFERSENSYSYVFYTAARS